MSKPALKSISAMNPEITADKGHEFEVMAGDESTGLFLTVVGKESSLYKAAIRKRVDRDRKAAFERDRTGKQPTFRSLGDDIRESIETYAECVIAWRGNTVIDEAADGPEPLPFSLENVQRLLAFDFVRVQVEREILGLSDFTQG